jgi:cobaltochelatase CobS
MTNQPVTRIQFFGDMRPSDLIGDVEMIETEAGNVITSWDAGDVVIAMERGHILLIDELDNAPPQVHSVLQRVCERHHNPQKAIADGRPHATLRLPNGAVVKAHPAFRIIATANTVGTGDATGDYAGTYCLNAAFLDRFGVKMRYSYPDTKTWTNILVGKTGCSLSDAKAIVAAAELINGAKAKARCRVSLSPRKSLVWARLGKRIGSLSLAAKLAIIEGIAVGDPDQKLVADIIRQVVGV